MFADFSDWIFFLFANSTGYWIDIQLDWGLLEVGPCHKNALLREHIRCEVAPSRDLTDNRDCLACPLTRGVHAP